MATYFASDHHFGHLNIIAYCGRPYASVDEMGLDLVRRHNSVVGPEDSVFFLGDVAMGKLDESLAYFALMHGKKFLVPGNHDRMFGLSGAKYDAAVSRYLDAGFDAVLPESVAMEDLAFGKAHLCHLPPSGDSRDEPDRFADKRPAMPAHGLLLHGHLHGKYRKRGRLIDVGVDAHGGFPVSERAIVEMLDHDDLAPLPYL